MDSTKSGLIVLTAAVSPHSDVPFTALSPLERLELYKAGFSFWLAEAISMELKLVVVETTGQPAHSFFTDEELAFVHFINFSPNPRFNKFGKGALEAECLDHAVSVMSDLYAPETTFHKVTGKLIVPNVKSILRPQADREITIRRSLDRSVCDTRIFSTTLGTWQAFFSGMSEFTNDLFPDKYIEHVIANNSVLGEFGGGLTVSQFSKIPKIKGISGSNGVAYGGFTKDGLSNVISHVEKLFITRFKKRLI
ncbi:hypothetical protein M2119_000017 [Aurantimicrobium minutum]|uniref:hypothetical protein n=1 Tax=Aurantimicrobium minutum TaxID=708131 RepID=UPI002472FD90|nr:hypothetical protein [Aurantimicrobium minutum]MDH6531780.1 hypothetical protein [Aurantimicrobium minutum]